MNTSPSTPPKTSTVDTFLELIWEYSECQKQIDFGGSDWAEYADRWAKLKTIIPEALNQLLYDARIQTYQHVLDNYIVKKRNPTRDAIEGHVAELKALKGES
jgi:hypothetical protein